jgi:hypothetical protein
MFKHCTKRSSVLNYRRHSYLMHIGSDLFPQLIFCEKQWDKISLFISFIFIFRFSYRHSLDSTSLKIKSEIKVHNIWVKHYKIRQWDKISLFQGGKCRHPAPKNSVGCRGGAQVLGRCWVCAEVTKKWA